MPQSIEGEFFSDESEEWNDSDEISQDLNGESEPEDSLHNHTETSSFETSLILARWLAQFLLHLQSSYRLSNAVIACIFSFLSTFLCVLGRFSSKCNEIAKAFPNSMYLAKKKFCDKFNFKRYAVCRKCHQIYPLGQCLEIFAGRQRPKSCSFQRFPKHTQRRMREECRTPLLKIVKLPSEKRIFYPYLTYCYLGLKIALKNFVRKPNFLSQCNEWQARSVPCESLMDVYDGKVWSEFQSEDHQKFLLDSNSLAFMLNIDFFQPFKHTTYSVGAIYISQSLTCHVQFVTSRRMSY